MPSWLVVGHGSVGAFLAGRLAGDGPVAILDPSPRLPVVAGTHVDNLAGLEVDHVVSCVPPGAAEEVAPGAAGTLRAGGLFFDWNTVSPAVKRRIGAALAVPVVDVALLDSLDGAPAQPTLAVSGPEAGRAALILEGLGFAVSVAGADVGEAAALKYLRSLFMKTLEALALEYAALAAGLDPEGVVRDSIGRNLGAAFLEFTDLLVATNRVHAERRRAELADAVASFGDDGARPELAAAAVSVLRQAEAAWHDTDAPAADAGRSELSAHLRSALGREQAPR